MNCPTDYRREPKHTKRLSYAIFACIFTLASFFTRIPTILCKTFVNFFHVLAQLLFPTKKTERDYYHQKVNVPVAPRVALRKLLILGN